MSHSYWDPVGRDNHLQACHLGNIVSVGQGDSDPTSRCDLKEWLTLCMLGNYHRLR